MELTGAEIVVRSLADEGVRHVFGYPGGAALHIYDALYKQDRVQHILARHEQGAAHEFKTRAAWISVSGSVSSASAQAIRSGS